MLLRSWWFSLWKGVKARLLEQPGGDGSAPVASHGGFQNAPSFSPDGSGNGHAARHPALGAAGWACFGRGVSKRASATLAFRRAEGSGAGLPASGRHLLTLQNAAFFPLREPGLGKGTWSTEETPAVRRSVRSEAGPAYPASGQLCRGKQHLIWVAGFSLLYHVII